MNANNAVEQSAALIVCSAERAEALGVPRDRWVFPRAGTQAHDTYAVSHRPDLRLVRRHPAGGPASCSRWPGAGVDDVAHVDLYSCFPSAVEIGADEIGLGLDRQLTVTGGLSFAGGPWNNYVTHSIATMADVLRADPGALGLVTANGGYVTKHALGLYSTEPPAGGFRWADVQDAVDALPRRELCEASTTGGRRRHRRVVGGGPRPRRRSRAGAGRLPARRRAAGLGVAATTPPRWPRCARAPSRSAAASRSTPTATSTSDLSTGFPRQFRSPWRPKLTGKSSSSYAVMSRSLAWKACCSSVGGPPACMAMSLVMSPSTLIWPDMNACMPACWLPSMNIALATS